MVRVLLFFALMLVGCGNGVEQSPEPVTPARFHPLHYRIVDGFIQEAGGRVFRGAGALVFDAPFAGETPPLRVELQPGAWIKLVLFCGADITGGITLGLRREPGTDALQVLLETPTSSQNLSLEFEGETAGEALSVQLEMVKPNGLRVNLGEKPSRFFPVTKGTGTRWGVALEGATLTIGSGA